MIGAMRGLLGGRMMERLTDAVAAAGIATWFTPELYQWTSDFSQAAAMFMPILGCLWLGVKTITHLHNHFRGREDHIE
jgi:hypothetical protein